jgi:cysteine synthase
MSADSDPRSRWETGTSVLSAIGRRRLAREEGIFGGFSGGACLVAAERLLRGRHASETIAIVIADSGMKYLSTDLWKADRDG